VGALQVAFEQLKEKLYSEGIFEHKHKRALPFLPREIAVITSPTGSVIQDFLHVTHRRFPNMAVHIVPVKVQGEDAAKQIVAAFGLLGERGTADVVVLARGGGSLEDLQAFNSEAVARAIFSCDIPVVSAVGHETDYTIADLVADLRAPTPSAAAELVVPEKSLLLDQGNAILTRLSRAMLGRLGSWTDQVRSLSARLIHPSKKIVDWRLRIDDLVARGQRACIGFLGNTKNRIHFARIGLARHGPRATINALGSRLERSQQRLRFAATNVVDTKKGTFQVVAGKLHALNPLAVLERGFSVTRSLPSFSIVKDVVQVRVGEQVAVKVARGEMVCRVERK
jgi:exodeoxyribonuclease VII large subunit